MKRTVSGPKEQKGIVIPDRSNPPQARIMWDQKVSGVYMTKSMYPVENFQSDICPACKHTLSPHEGTSIRLGELVKIICPECNVTYFYIQEEK